MKSYYVIKFPESNLYLSKDKCRKVSFAGNYLKLYKSKKEAINDLINYTAPFIIEKIYHN